MKSTVLFITVWGHTIGRTTHYIMIASVRGANLSVNLSATQKFKVIINMEERMRRKCISKINLVIERFTTPYNLLISIATAKFMFT